MCNNVVDSYPSTLKFVVECYKTQKMCNKTVNWFFIYLLFFVSDSIPDQNKTQEICDRVISEDPFLIVVYCPDKYKTQKNVIKLLMIL